MAQGKSKSSKASSQHSYHKIKKDARHGKIKKALTTEHHFSQPKPENIPKKNKDSTNDPAILSKIYNKQINQKITKKIKTHQKKIYKSIEQTIIDRAKKNKEVLEIL
jgi:hypothetical protein